MDKLDKIKKLIDTSQYHVYHKNKQILSAKTIKQLKSNIKNDVTPPTKNIKVYILELDIDPEWKYPLSINCSQYTITPKLALVVKPDDMSQTINYTKEDLKNYPFNLSHISKIIKAIKENLISFEKDEIFIKDIFDAVK